jgi:hypothetical protein
MVERATIVVDVSQFWNNGRKTAFGTRPVFPVFHHADDLRPGAFGRVEAESLADGIFAGQ